MRPLESAIERKVVRLAKELGVPSLKLTAVRGGAVGYPDRLFLIPGGRPLFIELKRAGEVPGPLQRFRHKELRALGYQVKVHDNADAAVRSIQRALRAAGSGR